MKTISFAIILSLSLHTALAQTGSEPEFRKWALTPPMGWNSWDCFGPSVKESEVKANADYMAANLKQSGWEYVVVDIRWYVDNQTTGIYNPFASSTFIYDEYGRYLPSPSRFPSSVDGAGFKPLADYVHAKGLKFGIHIMRGVPKKAVSNSLPIKGSARTAADIYTTADECTWLHDNYTILAEKEGAQEYYNSIFELYASWGVDFVKVDDLSRPYHRDEIEMIRNAIDNTGRPMVLSMSPGATPLDKYEHARDNANMWRTVDDFWDNWSQLNHQFGVCAQWAPYITPGAWPDADMLPMGHIAIRGERGVDRQTNFTQDEQFTLMTLWTMFRSPLMFGGHLPDNDTFTNDLITNEEVLAVHAGSLGNRQWFNRDDEVAWIADDPVNGDKFVALFNNGGDGFVSTKDLLYRSGTVSTLTDGYGVHIDLEIPAGSSQLFLVVTDGGDNINCDHADWISPTVYLDSGDSIKLTELAWEYASAGWNTVRVNKSVSGGSLNIKGTVYANGLGTHSRSVILYEIPENSVRFKTFAGLDIGGTNQGCGSTVEFMVALQDPTLREVDVSRAIANSGRISRTIRREGVYLTADITGAEKLYLVVTDAGDNFNYDHGDWINPAIYKDNGDSLLLTSLDWVSATSGWATVRKSLSLDGHALKVNGVTYPYGFGVNSYSIIEFDLPAGYTAFRSFCGFDDEVLGAPDGVTIEFLVFTEDPAIEQEITIPVDLDQLGFIGACNIRDLWAKNDLGIFSGADFSPSIAYHGAGLFRISALNRSDNAAVTLTGSADSIQTGDPLVLDVQVSETGVNSGDLSGWVQIWQNNSVIANLEIDTNGNARLNIPSLNEGEYTFRTHYGGNSLFSPQESNELPVKVYNITEKVKESISINSDIWITSSSGTYYLNGLHPGDRISIYDLHGRKISAMIAGSDRRVIDGRGIVIIEVVSGSDVKRLKTVLVES